ncbi:MAG: hypothetical protein V4441_06470 [Pseudomonadota bacterium]
MLETLMLIALGFLIATLFGLIAVQLTWRSAVKQTTRKLTEDLNLDELKQSADRAARLGVNLQDKQQEVSGLTARNTQLEETLAGVRDHAQQLNDEIATLQQLHATAQAEAETHLQNVTQLQARVDALETAARQDLEQRGAVEKQLRTLGDKANRLLADMSSVAAEIGNAHGLLAPAPARVFNPPASQASPVTEEPESPPLPLSTTSRTTPVPVAPVLLTPFTDDDDVLLSDDMPDFAEIKASLAAMGEGQPLPADITAEPASATESYIADRLRALKDGVTAQA